LVENRDFATVIGGPFDMEKLKWCDYPMVKKIEDMFIRFDRTHERDGQTDGRTSHDGIGSAHA